MPRRAALPAHLHPGLLTLARLVTALLGGAGTPAEPKGLPAEGETSLLGLGASGPKLRRSHPTCPAALPPPPAVPAGAQKPKLTDRSRHHPHRPPCPPSQQPGHPKSKHSTITR